MTNIFVSGWLNKEVKQLLVLVQEAGTAFHPTDAMSYAVDLRRRLCSDAGGIIASQYQESTAGHNYAK